MRSDIGAHIAPTFIDTPRGRCELIKAPGLLNVRLLAKDEGENCVGIVLYSPALDDEPYGLGMIHMLDADSARATAAGLIRAANDLDGRKPN
ncbi:hypothetical protein KZ810_13200 [Sphingomonas sp. RHCKR47]|uniref:hypothetical protein n=1 Tax=Sphingomonas citricola TaxID=2862498 RepID=UPI001CA56393|nr:hypothetical protein [Sphingomonas citricola]MBW6524459.1 hypothetical protein [Sphingomonas citricola]